MKKLLNILFLLMVLSSVPAFAQEVEMADAMRSSGKIYVVVAVMVSIFIGLAIWLFSMDRRLRKLEKTD